MNPTCLSLSAVLLIALILGGCNIYREYGHGNIVNSKMGSARQTPGELPANASLTSQSFNPRIGPSSATHRGIDGRVPTRTPVLAATDGLVSQGSLSLLYDRHIAADHGRAAASLTYPVPCPGLGWQRQ